MKVWKFKIPAGETRVDYATGIHFGGSLGFAIAETEPEAAEVLAKYIEQGGGISGWLRVASVSSYALDEVQALGFAIL